MLIMRTRVQDAPGGANGHAQAWRDITQKRLKDLQSQDREDGYKVRCVGRMRSRAVLLTRPPRPACAQIAVTHVMLLLGSVDTYCPGFALGAKACLVRTTVRAFRHASSLS